MNGRIWLESEIGKGTTVHFTVELGAQQKDVQTASSDRPVNLTGLEVLIIDDNDPSRKTVQELTKGWKMNPTGCASATAAFTLLEHRSFDLILVNLQTPGIDNFALVEIIGRDWPEQGKRIVLMSSLGRRTGDNRCRDRNIASYLCKPVLPAGLLECIEVLFRTPPEPVRTLGSSHPFSPGHPELAQGYASCAYPLNILVAEDNAVNQKLVSWVLEKQGHRVTLAENGRCALEAFEKTQFDLILMDVQMPVMDGFEAVTAIRRHEALTLDSGRIPIVAMTAHAMTGYRERCLEAGMDGYVSKPIQKAELFRVIEALCREKPVLQTVADAVENR